MLQKVMIIFTASMTLVYLAVGIIILSGVLPIEVLQTQPQLKYLFGTIVVLYSIYRMALSYKKIKEYRDEQKGYNTDETDEN